MGRQDIRYLIISVLAEVNNGSITRKGLAKLLKVNEDVLMEGEDARAIIMHHALTGTSRTAADLLRYHPDAGTYGWFKYISGQ
jgi:hypothetical protein